MLAYLHQIGRALSRLLNALLGGDGATTMSAASYELALAGSKWGKLRVAFIDRLPFNKPGHCLEAHAFHVRHGLIPASAQMDGGLAPQGTAKAGRPKGA